MSKSNLTAERLRELLHYDPSTGFFFWIHELKCGHNNNGLLHKAGDLAGGLTKNGRWHIRVDKTPYYAHRLAWLYTHGKFPDQEIDHINGNPIDNRIDNLRDVSRRVNAQNLRKPTKANTSGYLGVTQRGDRWEASIRLPDGTKIFSSHDTAANAYANYLHKKRLYHDGNTL